MSRVCDDNSSLSLSILSSLPLYLWVQSPPIVQSLHSHRNYSALDFLWVLMSSLVTDIDIS
jgi:hypothetical protein